MNNSNHTLRFSRTSREAYGFQARFEPDHHWAEPLIWVGAVFLFGTLFGLWIGG
jgi:hypothetical protein